MSAIRASGGKIIDETIIRKVLITLLPTYAIRVSAIQEMRCDPKNDITLDALVGRLTAFELDNFDNYLPRSHNIESKFKARLTLGRKGGNSKGKKSDNEEEEEFDDDIESIEALLARRLPKGKGKYKGKIPLICFSCEVVCHVATRCPNKEIKDDKKFNKFKGKKYFKSYKDYKDKRKKSCYIAKDSNSDDEDEMVYIAIKDELDDEDNEKMALISHVSKNDTWIIDSGCSHHMTGDKTKFEHTMMVEVLNLETMNHVM